MYSNVEGKNKKKIRKFTVFFFCVFPKNHTRTIITFRCVASHRQAFVERKNKVECSGNFDAEKVYFVQVSILHEKKVEN